MKSRPVRPVLAFAIAAIVMSSFVANDSAKAAVVVSNTTAGITTLANLEYDVSRLAQSFDTGSVASILNAVTLVVQNDDPGAPAQPMTFVARLHTDSAGDPDSVLNVFVDEPVLPGSTGATNITFDNINFALDAATTYWVSLQALDAPADDSGDEALGVGWRTRPNGTDTSAFGWSIGDNNMHASFNAGSTWNPVTNRTGLLEIDATLIPTPAAFTAGLLVLACLAGRRRRRA